MIRIRSHCGFTYKPPKPVSLWQRLQIDVLPLIMSEASSSASKFDTALALFSKGKGGSNSGRKATTMEQAQKKKAATAKERRVATAHSHVKDKWDAICALKGLDRNKHATQTKFTEDDLKGREVRGHLLEGGGGGFLQPVAWRELGVATPGQS